MDLQQALAEIGRLNAVLAGLQAQLQQAQIDLGAARTRDWPAVRQMLDTEIQRLNQAMQQAQQQLLAAQQAADAARAGQNDAQRDLLVDRARHDGEHTGEQAGRTAAEQEQARRSGSFWRGILVGLVVLALLAAFGTAPFFAGAWLLNRPAASSQVVQAQAPVVYMNPNPQPTRIVVEWK